MPLTAAEDAEKIAGQLEQYGYRTFRVWCLPETVNQKGESQIDRQGAVRVQELREAIAPSAIILVRKAIAKLFPD